MFAISSSDNVAITCFANFWLVLLSDSRFPIVLQLPCNDKALRQIVDHKSSTALLSIFHNKALLSCISKVAKRAHSRTHCSPRSLCSSQKKRVTTMISRLNHCNFRLVINPWKMIRIEENFETELFYTCCKWNLKDSILKKIWLEHTYIFLEI